MLLEKEPLTLAHPLVQAAKVRWNQQRFRKHSLTFEDLFEYFKANCVRHAAIAEEAGVTRERIRQVYDKYFRELFEGKSGTERAHACTLENRLVRTKSAETEVFARHETIVERARAAGLVVEAIPVMSDGEFTGRVYQQALSINGHRSSLHSATNADRTTDTCAREYSRVSISRQSIAVAHTLVVHVTVEELPERVFVIPAQLVIHAYFRTGNPKNRNIYLPTETQLPVYRNSRPRIDWRQHEDAWHLLAEKKPEPVSS